MAVHVASCVGKRRVLERDCTAKSGTENSENMFYFFQLNNAVTAAKKCIFGGSKHQK
jgi:hypothetical protein